MAGRAALPEPAWLADRLVDSPAADALVRLVGVLDELRRLDWDVEHDATVRTAALVLDQAEDVLAGVGLAALGEVDGRQAHRAEGAVTAAAWLAHRGNRDAADARRRAQAARRQGGFPLLRAALLAGRISRNHLYALTDAAAGRVGQALEEVEPILHGLAVSSTPRVLRVAVRRVGEVVARDGVDDPPEPIIDGAADLRRELHLRPGLDGLGDLVGTLDQLTREKLAVALDAFNEPDAAEVSAEQRRTPAQRRHDALDALLDAALASRDSGSVHGHTPRVALTVDLLDLFDLLAATPPGRSGRPRPDHTSPADLRPDPADPADPGDLTEALTGLLHDAGIDLDDLLRAHRRTTPAPADPAGPAGSQRAERLPRRAAPPPRRAGPPPGRNGPRLRFSGPYPRRRARALLLAAQITVILTCGPWRPISVGRSMRTLPAWLRQAMFALQPCCRGPNCDRPATWTQAHHTIEWAAGGDTDLDHTIPVCQTHHGMLTNDGWRVTLDPPTGTCTWTATHGGTYTTHPTG